MLREAFCALVAASLVTGPAWAVCEPWEGEPDPLPTRADPDSLRREWVELRALELGGAAKRFEGRDDLRAQQLWRHVLCIDPSSDEALAGVLRTSAVKVHRPALQNVPLDPARVSNAWASLAAPIGVRTVEPVPAGDSTDLLFAEVRELDELVRRARFDEALRLADSLRTDISATPRGSSRSGLLVETEVLAATAQLALGRDAEAVSSLQRALEIFPALALDPSTTSPKVVRALDTARIAAGEESP